MINTEDLTMGERSELIEVRAEQYYTALKALPRTTDGAIDSKAFAKAMRRLECDGKGFDLVDQMVSAIELLEAIDASSYTPDTPYNRTEARAWKLISEACDLFRVLTPFRY